jgi:hypothetical protein
VFVCSEYPLNMAMLKKRKVDSKCPIFRKGGLKTTTLLSIKENPCASFV